MDNPKGGVPLSPSRLATARRPPEPPTIQDRFRALLRQREDELRKAGELTPPPPTEGDILRFYEEVLAELVVNSKPIITDLTIIAGQHAEFAAAIANAVCNRIAKVPVDQKLPSLYLLDSIVKNIGKEYIGYFGAQLPKVFCKAYNQVSPSQYQAMRHLFGTWSQVFPSKVLRRIEDVLKFSPSNSMQQHNEATNPMYSKTESPRPAHGIHVNPKYLEIPHQSKQYAAEAFVGKGASHALQGYGQKAYGGQQDDYINLRDPPLPNILSASSSIPNVERPSASSRKQRLRPLSPQTFRSSRSPSVDKYVTGASHKVVLDRPSDSRSDLGYGHIIPGDENAWADRNWEPNDIAHNSVRMQNIRELIDAYGSDETRGSFHQRFAKMQRLDTNGTAVGSGTGSVFDFDLEEHAWEKMSPTLSDRNNKNSMPQMSSSVHSRVGTYILPKRELPDHEIVRHSWPGPGPWLPIKEQSSSFEDRVASSMAGGTLLNKYSHEVGFNSDSYHQNSHMSQEFGRVPLLPQQNTAPPLRAPAATITSTNRMPLSTDDQFQDRLTGRLHDSFNGEASVMEKQFAIKPPSPAVPSSIEWPPAISHPQTLQLPPPPPLPPLDTKHVGSSFDAIGNSQIVTNQVPSSSVFVPKHYISQDQKVMSITSLPQQQYQNQDSVLMAQQNQRVFPPSHGPEAFRPNLPVVPHQILQPRVSAKIIPSSLLASSLPSSVPMHMHPIMPPLPPGPPPGSLLSSSAFQNSNAGIPGSSSNALSGLLSTLMAQGVISLKPASQSEDHVGVEFSVDFLRERHESAITALYSELPRQCTTCGIRFKSQEEHSSHMDWHVTKNRTSKNRKQKPSRKWFVSAKEWLSGAEILGNDVVLGFLSADVPEKDDKEVAVPADENQTHCALCAEPLEDFYSDDTEEWMYRGAVYMNAPDGNTNGLERLQLGPIVHAKCLSVSNVTSG